MIYSFEGLTFQILTVERSLHKKGRFPVEGRPFSSLSFCVDGRASLTVGEQILSVEKGDILFIPRDTAFLVDCMAGESVSVCFADCNYAVAEVFRPKSTTEASLLFLKMLSIWKDRHSVNGVKSAVYAILERTEAEQNAQAEPPVAGCFRYITEHFSDPSLDITEVCSRGFVSVSSLQRAFARQFEMSPMQYVIGLRMDKAFRLLSENRLSVKEISSLCGFSDEKYFSRAFKKHYGYPPSHLCNHIAYWGEFSDERHFSRMLMSQSMRHSDIDKN